jgi:hypothetical protein
MRPIILACLLALLPVAAEAGCITDQYGGRVCGEGKDAARVIDDTTSPSEKYAVAWRCSTGLPTGKEFPGGDVDNVLIRLDDGKVLGTLGSSYWRTGELRPNRDELFAVWSPDSRAVVEGANSRWDTDVFGYHAIDADKVTKVDLLALVAPAIKAKIPASEREKYSFRVRQDLGIKVDARGHIRFKAMLFVPKNDSLDYSIDVAVNTKSGVPAARIASIRKIRIDPRL